MARHRASPVTVQRAIAALAAEGAARAAARARHLRGAARCRRRRRPTSRGRRWRSAPAPSRPTPLHELLAVPPPGAIPLSSGYLSLDLQPLALVGAALARAARRPGAWERGPVEGREELRAWFAREAGGQPARARRRRLLGRPARAGDRVPRPRRARRPGAGRGADLPGRHRRGPRRRAARRPRPQRRRRRAPRPARRGLRAHRRAPGLLPAALRQPPRLRARGRPPRRRARRRRRRGRVPARGRLGARPERRRPTRRRRWPPTIPTATSSTCAR